MARDVFVGVLGGNELWLKILGKDAVTLEEALKIAILFEILSTSLNRDETRKTRVDVENVVTW